MHKFMHKNGEWKKYWTVCVYVCADSESYTTTAAPEKSRNPLAVSGTRHSIDLEVTVPYNNGSVVYVCMYICMYPSAYM